MHDRGILRVGHRGDPGAEYLETGPCHQDRGVLVDAHAQVIRVMRDRAQQPRQPAALTEMHVDDQLRDEAEAGSGPHSGGCHLRALPAYYHRAAHGGGAGTGAGDDKAAGQFVAQNVVSPGADQRAKARLVAAAEEDAGGGGQHLGRLVPVGVRPAAEPEFPCLLHAELAEHSLILGVRLVGHAGRRSDEHDLRLVTAA